MDDYIISDEEKEKENEKIKKYHIKILNLIESRAHSKKISLLEDLQSKNFAKRGRPKSSFVYKYFSKEPKIFICNICFKTLPYSGSLTNMKSHLRSKHKILK